MASAADVFLDDELARWLAANLDTNWVRHARVRHIVTCRLQGLADESWQGVAAFLADREDDALRELVTEATTLDRDIPDPARQLRDVVQALRNQFVEQQMLVLRQRVNAPETSEADRIEAMRRYQKLMQTKSKPLEAPVNSGEPPSPQ